MLHVTKVKPLCLQIHIDIPRTNPLIPLFQQPAVQEVSVCSAVTPGGQTVSIGKTLHVIIKINVDNIDIQCFINGQSETFQGKREYFI